MHNPVSWLYAIPDVVPQRPELAVSRSVQIGPHCKQKGRL
jgi:hypothetical protein